MTLMQIELVLHYYYSPQEHPYVTDEWGGCRQAMNGLIADGMLELDDHAESERTYRTTEKARVYVEAVRAVPQPVQQWVMP